MSDERCTHEVTHMGRCAGCGEVDADWPDFFVTRDTSADREIAELKDKVRDLESLVRMQATWVVPPTRVSHPRYDDYTAMEGLRRRLGLER